MKKIYCWIFILLSSSVQAQDSTLKIRAVGVDAVKNFTHYVSAADFQNPIIAECYVQFFTSKPNHYFSISLGYADMSRKAQNHFLQSFRGYSVKTTWEQHSKTGRRFFGYSGVFSYGTVKGELEIQGNYFPTYKTGTPYNQGIGVALEGFVGTSALLFKRIETRFLLRGAAIIADIGNPQFPYLTGLGISYLPEMLSFNVGATIQFFYLIKRSPKRNLPD
jgi:hypothetical protein